MQGRRVSIPVPSQGPHAQGHGLGVGLAILSAGGKPGGGNGQPNSGGGFPATGILDTFTRADANTLGASWGQPLNASSLNGYTSVTMGISANQAYDRDTSVANKATSYWSVQTFSGGQEAYFTIGVPSGDWCGLTLRAVNPGGVSVKYYIVQMHDTSYVLSREDNQTTEVSLASGTTTALVANDRIGARCYTLANGNVRVELWVYRNNVSAWSRVAQATDSSANKLTAAGYIGCIFGNAAGSSAGRMDNFGGGTFQ